MNKQFQFTIKGSNQTINIPIEMKWDFYGRDDSIDIYEKDVLSIVAGFPEDFEVLRFAHESYGELEKTLLSYQFHFYSGDTSAVTTSTSSNWVVDYNAEGFTSEEIYYRSKPFKRSFYKLDFYDTRNNVTQTNYFTVILPTYNSDYNLLDLNYYIKGVKINKPLINLDYISGGLTQSFREGFFLYWLKSREFIDIDTFYMSIKFFDAKLGVFVRMMTQPQSALPDKFLFNEQDYFYLKVKLNYNTKTYIITDLNDVRIGVTSPINLYEYVNP